MARHCTCYCTSAVHWGRKVNRNWMDGWLRSPVPRFTTAQPSLAIRHQQKSDKQASSPWSLLVIALNPAYPSELSAVKAVSGHGQGCSAPRVSGLVLGIRRHRTSGREANQCIGSSRKKKIHSYGELAGSLRLANLIQAASVRYRPSILRQSALSSGCIVH